ncbi:MAG: carbohydrate ABC transporter substrate-binding protein, partial [Caldilineaceae bacterium]|nr:carbohydrate ABC transporter substrate-binding protein [Caldilineaceae bacterium]
MHRFRNTVLVTALLIFALVLAACAPVPVAAPAEAPAEGEAAATEAAEAPAPSGDVTELRITWYDDGNEGAVLRELLDRFEADNPDIKVVIDTVDYANGIQQTLPIQLEAGEGPDMARVTQLGIISQYMLDLRPYLSNPEYWEENFGPFLKWMQTDPDGNAIPGYMTQLTVTGPFINRTLFEQAGVAVPSDSSDQVTWQEWADAARQVAEAT